MTHRDIFPLAIDIRPDHWQIVRHILRMHVPQYAVWAFGSRVTWTAKTHSDLDLAIITESPLPLSVSAALADDFSESNLPWKVDVVDWAATSESFRMVIERDRIVVQTPNEMNGWSETTLGEVCKMQGGTIQTGPFGSQLHAADYTSTGTPVVMPVNLSAGSISDDGIARISDENAERLARHKLVPGDIVFSRRGDVTRFALVSERESGWLCGTGCLKVSVGNSSIAIPGFVAAVLASPESKEWLVRHAVGATMPNLNTEILASIPITLPPIEEQHAIAHILGTLDDKIELNRQQNKTLEEMAHALFKAWFVDFEPVRAKMEGRWQRGQSLPGLPAHLYDLFPERLVESELGEIPAGWEIRPVGDFAEIKGGKQLEKEHIAESGSVPVFGGAGVMGYTTNHNADGFVISVGRVGAYCGQFFSHRGKAWINNNASLICPYSEGLGEWLLVALRHIDMDVIKKGAAQPFVSNGDISKLGLVWPGDVLIHAFTSALLPLMNKAEANKRQSHILAQLRDTLLPKLISGKLLVSKTKEQGFHE